MPTEATSVLPTTEEIRAQLARILGSHIFAGAQRSQRFLKYVVEKSFDPGSDALKEYTIAVDVFERDASYDSSIDATVRVEAGRLRSRLHEYYAEDGKDDPLIIDVPKGGYRATFTRRPVAAPAIDGTGLPSATPFSVPAPHAASRKRGVWIAAACIFFLIALIGGGVVLRQRHRAHTPAMRTPIAMAILPFANQTGVGRRRLSLGGPDAKSHPPVFGDSAIEGYVAGSG